MEVKKDQIKKAVEECENNGASVRYSGAVLKIHDTKKGTAKRILIISNLFITYYKTGSKPIEDRKNYWRNVSSFNYEDNRIELYFDKAPFRFISENSSEIFDIIMEIFLRCFAPDEIAPLDLSRFAHPPIKVNGNGILNRNSIILASTDTKQTNNELDELKLFVEYSNPQFEIKGSHNYIKAILETIRAAPYLNIVIFPKEQETKHLYKIIANFIHKPSNVHLISLFNRPDDNFNQLSKKNNADSNATNKSNISALKFTDVEMEENDLERIKNFIMSANIDSLSLCHSLPSRLLKNFTTDFLESEVISKISYLCLDGTKRLRVNEIIGKLNNISILSLRNCNLEISKVFMSLAKEKIQSLRYLNLSHNKCSFTLKKFRLPPYLERIDLNSVQWNKSTLPQFLTLLFDQDLNDGLKLYINKINIDDHEWDSVFDTFESITKYPLVELSWNHNKVSRKFFDFLSNNIQITNLFLNGCFTYTNQEEIIQFSQILPNLSNCTHLVIRGDLDTYTLREKVSILFEYVKQMNFISYLDVTNNIISTEGLEQLSNLINECKRLTHICFDGSKIEDQGYFERLIEEGEKRRRPLFIDWPNNDIKNLKEKSKINDTNIQIYKDKLISLSTGISNAKTKAIRNSMQYISNNVSSFAKSSRMSMRMLKTENSAAQKEKKNKRSRSTVRDIRTGSFRGVKRPDLLIPEKSHMEFDPNSPLNKNFEVYKSYFTHKFPQYLSQNLKNIFACNPILPQELDDISFSDEEFEESNFESDDNPENSSKSLKIKTIEISQDYDNNSEEEEVIELALLNEPEIPLIDQLSIQKNKVDLDVDFSNSKLLKKILQLPKLNKIEKAPPLLQINKALSDVESNVDRSSLDINEQTKDLDVIKSEIIIDEVSDFQSSEDFDSDENLDDIKTYMNLIKDEDEI